MPGDCWKNKIVLRKKSELEVQTNVTTNSQLWMRFLIEKRPQLLSIHHIVKWCFANCPLSLMNVDSQYQVITA